MAIFPWNCNVLSFAGNPDGKRGHKAHAGMEKSQVRVALARGKPYNRNVKSQKREEIRVVVR